MSAYAARTPVPAQVRSKENKTIPRKGLSYMSIARGMLSQPMHKTDDSLGLDHSGLPTLRKDLQAVCRFPICFEMIHVILQL